MSDDNQAKSVERAFELERLIFFSDAVFAIAITLLALELHVPDLGENPTSDLLINAILSEWSHLFAFVLSFWIIAAYWIAHHRIFRYIIRYDGTLLLLNMLVLFWVVLVPFTTLVVGEYGYLPGGVWVYAADLFFLGVSLAWLWYHATRDHALVKPDLDPLFIRYMLVRCFATPATAILVFVASFFIGGVANSLWFLVWLFQYQIGRYYKFPTA